MKNVVNHNKKQEIDQKTYLRIIADSNDGILQQVCKQNIPIQIKGLIEVLNN